MKKLILGLCLMLSLCVVGGCQETSNDKESVISDFVNELFTLNYDADKTEDQYIDEAIALEVDHFFTSDAFTKYQQNGLALIPARFVVDNKATLSVDSTEFDELFVEDNTAGYQVTINLKLTPEQSDESHNTTVLAKFSVQEEDGICQIYALTVEPIDTQVIK